MPGVLGCEGPGGAWDAWGSLWGVWGVRVRPSAGPWLSVQIWCHRLAAVGSQGSGRSGRWPGHVPRQTPRAKLLLGAHRACEPCQSQPWDPHKQEGAVGPVQP